MVHFKIIKNNIYGYIGDTFLGSVGHVDKVTYQKMNYYRRKWEGKIGSDNKL